MGGVTRVVGYLCPQVRPQTAFGKAFGAVSLTNKWDKLMSYLQDNRLDIDNTIEKARSATRR